MLGYVGGKIRVTCFHVVVDKFFDRLESGKSYINSKGSLNPTQKNFNHLKNGWETLLDSTLKIEPCLEYDNSIPKHHFNFISISEVENMENNSRVDVTIVAISINPLSIIMRKNGTETPLNISSTKGHVRLQCGVNYVGFLLQ